MTLPNFLVIGTQKGGTTWLQMMLSQHPQVYMAKGEIHFFNNPRKFAKGRKWYEKHFAGATDKHMAIGEKTPSYLRHDPHRHFSISERIHELLPKAKLIGVFRNPVDRFISAVHHHRVRGRIDPSLSLDELLEKELRQPSRMFIDFGFYYDGLAPFYRLFPSEQILPLIYETHIRDDASKEATARRICEFLGIDENHSFVKLDRRANRSDQISTASLRVAHALRIPKSTLLWRGFTVALDGLLGQRYERLAPSAAMRRRLYDIYAPENAKFFELLGYEVKEWQEEAPQ